MKNLIVIVGLVLCGCGDTKETPPQAHGSSDGVQSPYKAYLPQSAPSETNRVQHPAGFSIISPPGWKFRLVHPESFLKGYVLDQFDLHGTQDDEYKPQFSIQRLGDEGAKNYNGAFEGNWVTVDKYIVIQFQGEPALERFVPGYGKSEAIRGSYQPWLLQELVFKREGRWFNLTFQMRNADSGRPYFTQPVPIIRQYFETFRYDLPHN